MEKLPVNLDLSYAQVHLFYTIPLTFVLWLVARPLLDATTWTNIVFLCSLALVYTTPWDNFLVWTKTWGYPENSVIGTLGLVPVEEYFFFIIQTIMVTLWAFLCLRWSIPFRYLQEASPIRANLIRWVPIPFVVFISVASWIRFKDSEMKYFYISCILGWALPVIALLWIGGGNYIMKRRLAVTLAILPPTIYLWTVDLIALRAGVWVINPKATVGIYVYDILPLEEAVFFFIVNVIIVFGYCGLDKSITIIHNFPKNFVNNRNILSQMCHAFFILESKLPQEPIKELERVLTVLHNASNSFRTVGIIFPTAIRHDLSTLYAFLRVTGDMVDDRLLTLEEKQTKLSIIKDFLDQLFAYHDRNKSWTYGIGKSNVNLRNELPAIDWGYFEVVLSVNELATFRCLSRIAYYLPPEPFYKLCQGYDWDIKGTIVRNQADLVKYSEYVAGSVGVLCAYVICKTNSRWSMLSNNDLNLGDGKHKEIIEAARSIGVSLQLINIARDIVTHSETLGRCYIPLDYLDTNIRKNYFELLTKNRSPWDLGEDNLRSLSLRILKVAQEFKLKGGKGILMLPEKLRRPVFCVTEIYSVIGQVIQQTSGYDKRASAKTWTKLWILFQSIYLPIKKNY